MEALADEAYWGVEPISEDTETEADQADRKRANGRDSRRSRQRSDVPLILLDRVSCRVTASRRARAARGQRGT